ncbi:MAG: AraC family transcriptional regulator [Clostridiaceae bacterium]|nr:AraC family transcriptional regulator [Clostridiaceae bacterium]
MKEAQDFARYEYFEYLDKEEYKDILLIRVSDNKHGGLPVFVRKYILQPGAELGLHRHESMQINYICQGKGGHYINKHEFEIVKGDIFVIPPYIPHKISAAKDSNIQIFEFEFVPGFIYQNFGSIENVESFFDFAYIEPFLVGENNVKPRLNLVGKIQVEVENILNEVLMEYNNRRSGYLLVIKSLLLKLLVMVGREFTRELQDSETRPAFERHRDSIFEAIEYINRNYMKDLTVEEAARKSMLSQSYFSYLFKSITTKTFTEYLNDLRISRAMELLASTDKRVLDICYEAGFNNVNHFNRLFKQKTGVSPRTYRRLNLNA